jgi:hypothetical protein
MNEHRHSRRRASVALSITRDALVALLLIGCSFSHACAAGRLPWGPGLAARHPGDRGLARDPRVLLAEDFEAGSLTDLGKRWSSVSNEGDRVLAYSGDVPVGGGKRSLQMTATVPANTGGHLYTRLPRGVDRLFARFYVKFPGDPDYIHHFVTVGGYNPSTPWPQGGAGERPIGNDRITVGIEPFGLYGSLRPPGAWNFYAYWAEMKVSAGGRFWGQSLRPEKPLLVPRDGWQCVEVMVKLNSAPEKADGELALWLDGVLAMHIAPGTRRGEWTGLGFVLPEMGGTPFEGFRFRTSMDLKLNFLWLLHYVTENSARQNRVAVPSRPNVVRFDNIVVATEYIGPMVPSAAAERRR